MHPLDAVQFVVQLSDAALKLAFLAQYLLLTCWSSKVVRREALQQGLFLLLLAMLTHRDRFD